MPPPPPASDLCALVSKAEKLEKDHKKFVARVQALETELQTAREEETFNLENNKEFTAVQL
jgi:hypothetical protein